MKQAAHSRVNTTLLAFGLLAFACRFAIPPGYMPAPLHEGGPIVFCPAGMPSGFGADSEHDHHDNHGTGGETSAWEHCPLGALFDADSVTAEIVFELPAPQQHQLSAFAIERLFKITSAPFRARATPAFDPIV